MLEIIEVIDDTVQGLTNPALCIANDGQKYIIKGREAQNIGLIKEYLCACLGQEFGLPIPDFCLAEFSNELLSYDDELQRRFAGGPCFASKYIPNLQEFDRSSYSENHAQFFKDLFVFDFWVKNDDRNFIAENGGNPNLLVDGNRNHIYVIDHNLAFDSTFDLQSFREKHLGCKYWFDGQLQMFNQEQYQERMDSAVQLLNVVVDQLPPEWIDEPNEAAFIQTAFDQLKQFETNNFWGTLQ